MSPIEWLHSLNQDECNVLFLIVTGVVAGIFAYVFFDHK